MKFKLIFPGWKKLTGQTEFHLPPHAPVNVAAAIPDDVGISPEPTEEELMRLKEIDPEGIIIK